MVVSRAVGRWPAWALCALTGAACDAGGPGHESSHDAGDALAPTLATSAPAPAAEGATPKAGAAGGGPAEQGPVPAQTRPAGSAPAPDDEEPQDPEGSTPSAPVVDSSPTEEPDSELRVDAGSGAVGEPEAPIEPEAPVEPEAPIEPEVMVEPGAEPTPEPTVAPPSYPAPGEYGELAPLPEANSEMAVAEVNGVIYVLGGYPSSREVQTTVQAYDPEADAWSLVAPLPTPLHHPVVVGFDGKLYSFGGQVSQDQNPDTDRTFVYDPSADAWTDLAPMPTARGAGAGAIVDGRVFVIAGRPPAGNAMEAYDVAADTWQALPPLPNRFDQRNHLAATAISGLVYVAGGRYDGGGFSSPMTASLDIFDPASGEWALGAEMPRPRGGVNGVAAHGCFHVWGGEGSSTGEPNDVFPDHDVYDPVADSWSRLAPLPTPVHGVTGAVFLNGLIYIPGGGTSSGGSSGSTVFQVYHPTTRCD